MNPFNWDNHLSSSSSTNSVSSSRSSVSDSPSSRSPITPEDSALTPEAHTPSAAAGDHSPTSQSGKVSEWPFAVGSLDFNVFEQKEASSANGGATNATVQTIIPASVPAAVGLSQNLNLDDLEIALGPLERLQRKWGIGDRKTRDGQPAKRRGPKPDSKPAMTRRQELNRQAQRTHRERKESYMRELETTVSHLRRLYQEEVEAVRTENKKLRAILDAHGIHYDVSSVSPGTSMQFTTASPGGFPVSSPPNFATSQSMSTAYNSMSSTAQALSMMNHSVNTYGVQPQHHSALQQTQALVPGMDYNELGLDFVGTYGRTPYLSPPPNQ